MLFARALCGFGRGKCGQAENRTLIETARQARAAHRETQSLRLRPMSARVSTRARRGLAPQRRARAASPPDLWGQTRPDTGLRWACSDRDGRCFAMDSSTPGFAGTLASSGDAGRRTRSPVPRAMACFAPTGPSMSTPFAVIPACPARPAPGVAKSGVPFDVAGRPSRISRFRRPRARRCAWCPDHAMNPILPSRQRWCARVRRSGFGPFCIGRRHHGRTGVDGFRIGFCQDCGKGTFGCRLVFRHRILRRPVVFQGQGPTATALLLLACPSACASFRSKTDTGSSWQDSVTSSLRLCVLFG